MTEQTKNLFYAIAENRYGQYPVILFFEELKEDHTNQKIIYYTHEGKFISDSVEIYGYEPAPKTVKLKPTDHLDRISYTIYDDVFSGHDSSDVLSTLNDFICESLSSKFDLLNDHPKYDPDDICFYTKEQLQLSYKFKLLSKHHKINCFDDVVKLYQERESW